MKSNLRICPQCGTETTALTCRNDGFGTVDAGRYKKHDPTALIGTLFQDRYRVDAVLGSGGMGSVYRATQVRVGRQVALKVINAELAWDLAVVARFQREGRAIAALIHPNIVQVYDFGQTDEGQLFMAMELVGGKTLADVIREEAPLDPTRVVHIGSQIFDALAEAHEHGVIHRDLKPENIFVSETGRRRDVVKIVDFGVAKIVNEPKSESMVTARGAILGSPKYMAPEQARG
ncbi:MAG: serine/threonine protein kinase, partial [Myxococcales bacterium]|nr:serine/threonine protein kinase [Myxococcales bacterium]